MNSAELERSRINRAVRRRLARSEATNLESLEQDLELERDKILRSLQELEAEGAVAVLRPVSASTGSDGRPDWRDYYRLVRETDNDYLWEQDNLVRLPAGSVVEVRRRDRDGTRMKHRPGAVPWMGAAPYSLAAAR